MNQQPKTQPWLWIILAAVVIIGGGLTYWYVTSNNSSDITAAPSPTLTKTSSPTNSANQTADWKTYTNNTYGFSFKYPKDWYIDEMVSANGIAVIANYPNANELNKENSPDNLQQLLLVKTIAEGTYSKALPDAVIKSQNLNNITTYEFRNLETGDKNSTLVWNKVAKFKIGEQYFELAALGESIPSNRKLQLDTFDAILTTFQFTK